MTTEEKALIDSLIARIKYLEEAIKTLQAAQITNIPTVWVTEPYVGTPPPNMTITTCSDGRPWSAIIN